MGFWDAKNPHVISRDQVNRKVYAKHCKMHVVRTNKYAQSNKYVGHDIAAQMILGKDNRMADHAEQFLDVYECNTIESYYLRPTNNCCTVIPIYNKKAVIKKKRFLLRATKDMILYMRYDMIYET